MTDASDHSGALPDPRDQPRLGRLPWMPLEGAPEGWEVAHRGAGKYLLQDPSGGIVNALDHLWELQECRKEVRVERKLARLEAERTSPLRRLHGVRRSWLGWSVERLEAEAAEILGRPEPVDLEDLSEDELDTLIAEWEPIHDTRREA